MTFALTLRLLAICLSFALAGGPAWATGAPMASHVANYEITLDRAASSAGVVGAAGQAVYKVTKDCSGWLVENHTSLLIGYDDDRSFRQVWSMATWESEDGTSFRSRVVEYRPEGKPDRVSSRAHLTADGGLAVFTDPEPLERRLEAGAQFPMQHLADIFKAARRGDTQMRRILFDGGNTDNPYVVNVAILGASDATKAAAIEKKFGLVPVPSWRVHMAFYPYQAQSAVPDYEIIGSFRSDGIAFDLKQDFGDFSLLLTLKTLEKLTAPEC